MNAHTPGPWHVTGQSTGGRYITVCASKRTIARVLFSKDNDPAPTDAGDANLIAAAPELLAALQAIIHEENSGGLELYNGGSRAARKAMQDARAAIAKAEGRA